MANMPYKPKNGRMSLLQRRIMTYSDWFGPHKPDPLKLSECGLYYTGDLNIVQCYFCGVHIRYFKDSSDLWEDHKKASPKCYHLKMTKKKSSSDVVKTSDGDIDLKQQQQQTSGLDKVELLLCKICMTNERNVLLKPCHHVVVCSDCSDKIAECSVCRELITEKIKIFIS